MSVPHLAEGLRGEFACAQRLSPIEYASSQSSELDAAEVRRHVADALDACLVRTGELLRGVEAAADGVVADLAFGASFELSQSLKNLRREQSGASLIVSCETARRKLCRSLFAVVNTVADFYDVARLDTTLDARGAVEVRKLYAKFRQSLRMQEEVSAENIATCLQYAATALAAVFASPAFAGVRIEDARLLREIRDRVFAWAQAGKSPKEGLQLFHDIETSAEILRGINRRQELQLHDNKHLKELLEYLASDDSLTRLDVVSRLSEIAGRSDEVDDLALRIAEEGLNAPTISRLRGLVTELLESLPTVASGTSFSLPEASGF